MHLLESNTPFIITLCKAHKVKSLYAFGSVVTDHFNNDSDIDLIVAFKDVAIEDYADNYFVLKFSLQDLLQRPIDLLEEQAIKNPYFRSRINKQRQLVYEQ